MSESASPVPLPGPATPRKPISIDRAVEEGILIATSALTMEVKNQIIIDAIRDARPYDVGHVVAVAKRQLLALARQNVESSDRIQHLAEDVLTPKGSTDSEGYRAGDHPALANRAVIHSRVSAELERLADDDAYIQDVAEAARAEAWTEVGDAVQLRLLRSVPPEPDKFYEEDKAARIQALFAINFRALEKRAKKLGLAPLEGEDRRPDAAPRRRRLWPRRKK
jgi:hypothetical protein